MRQILLYPDHEDGGWVAEVPSLPGCVTQGATREEAVANVRDAIKTWIMGTNDLCATVCAEQSFEEGNVLPGGDSMNVVVRNHIFTYQTLAGGDADFIRDVGIPFVDSLDAALAPAGVFRNDEDLDDFLRLDTNPVAASSALVGIVGLFAFLGSWAAKKFLDEAYEVTIQPAVKACFRGIQEPRSGSKRVCEFGIWYEEGRVFVLLGIVGDDFEGICEQLDLVPAVHANAIAWILRNGRQKPIHMYLIEDAKVNVSPIQFASLNQAHAQLAVMYPSKPTLS